MYFLSFISAFLIFSQPWSSLKAAEGNRRLALGATHSDGSRLALLSFQQEGNGNTSGSDVDGAEGLSPIAHPQPVLKEDDNDFIRGMGFAGGIEALRSAMMQFEQQNTNAPFDDVDSIGSLSPIAQRPAHNVQTSSPQQSYVGIRILPDWMTSAMPVEREKLLADLKHPAVAINRLDKWHRYLQDLKLTNLNKEEKKSFQLFIEDIAYSLREVHTTQSSDRFFAELAPLKEASYLYDYIKKNNNSFFDISYVQQNKYLSGLLYAQKYPSAHITKGQYHAAFKALRYL